MPLWHHYVPSLCAFITLCAIMTSLCTIIMYQSEWHHYVPLWHVTLCDIIMKWQCHNVYPDVKMRLFSCQFQCGKRAILIVVTIPQLFALKPTILRSHILMYAKSECAANHHFKLVHHLLPDSTFGLFHLKMWVEERPDLHPPPPL